MVTFPWDVRKGPDRFGEVPNGPEGALVFRSLPGLFLSPGAERSGLVRMGQPRRAESGEGGDQYPVVSNQSSGELSVHPFAGVRAHEKSGDFNRRQRRAQREQSGAEVLATDAHGSARILTGANSRGEKG